MLYNNEKHAFSTGIFETIEKEKIIRLSSESKAGVEEEEDNFSFRMGL